jgi:hypothetical protein
MPDLPEADFAKGPYYYLTYLKHELIYEALKVADEVFFFDVDVILLRNPWIEVQYGRDGQGNRISGPYDLQWQRENGQGPRFDSCYGRLLSPLLFIARCINRNLYLLS